MLIQERLKIFLLADHMLTGGNHHTAGLERTPDFPACLREILGMMKDLPAVDKIKTVVRKRKGFGIIADDMNRQASLTHKRPNGPGTNKRAWIRLKSGDTPAITGEGVAADAPASAKIKGISRHFR